CVREGSKDFDYW
nr:immunoglobulin heavy chain junction region [Mus musculus]MBK4195081.1 immunoglobulin heavy chain junction region [Mus musculus]